MNKLERIMKNRHRLLAISVALACSTAVFAVPIVETHNFNGLGLPVPDGNPSGLGDLQPVTSQITEIESVIVTLDIGGTWNGDLYAYLTHDTGYAVLLNRSGRTAIDSFGYGDSGYQVTLDDSAADNIHTYRDVTVPAVGVPLSGTWQPDGRNVDPDSVFDTTPSTAMLSSFNGTDANGNWTLFVADLSGGDAHTLNSWGMTITGIPEPSSVLLLAIGAAIIIRHRLSIFS